MDAEDEAMAFFFTEENSVHTLQRAANHFHSLALM